MGVYVGATIIWILYLRILNNTPVSLVYLVFTLTLQQSNKNVRKENKPQKYKSKHYKTLLSWLDHVATESCYIIFLLECEWIARTLAFSTVIFSKKQTHVLPKNQFTNRVTII